MLEPELQRGLAEPGPGSVAKPFAERFGFSVMSRDLLW